MRVASIAAEAEEGRGGTETVTNYRREEQGKKKEKWRRAE